MYFDKYMLFDVHLNELQKKVTGILMYINRLSKCFDKSTRILVAQSLALSTIYRHSSTYERSTCEHSIHANIFLNTQV